MVLSLLLLSVVSNEVLALPVSSVRASDQETGRFIPNGTLSFSCLQLVPDLASEAVP